LREFVAEFLLPLVRGGTLLVGRPLGRRELESELQPRLPAMERGRDSALRTRSALEELRQCRWRVATTLLPEVAPPPFDEATLRLGHAVHNLLALLHPGLAGPGAERRQARLARSAAELGALGSPQSAVEAVNRHSLLSRLSDVTRSDHVVHFWMGRQRFVGRPPPPRVVALPRLRGVKVETTTRAWLREIGVPAAGRPALLALHLASPLGEALDPLRLDPPPSWATILPVLRFPALGRIIAGRIVELGVDAAAGALAEALFRFVSRQSPGPGGQEPTSEAAAFAIRFLAHTVWLDQLYQPRDDDASIPQGGVGAAAGPGGGTDLAALLSASAAAAPSLVWPADVPRASDLGRAFSARLGRYRVAADAALEPRFAAAVTLCRFAATGMGARRA